MDDTKDKGEIEEVSLDSTLDDIEDLPGFNIPPTGAYVCLIEGADGEKVINEKKAIQFDFKIDSIVEMTGEVEMGEDPPKVGDMFSSMWFRNNKFALDNFKKSLARVLSEKLGTKVLSEILAQCKGLQLMMVIKRKKDKKDPDKWRLEIKKAAIL